MIGSNAFNYINVLDKAADASMVRQQALNNNIANSSTPNYKRKDVKFESYLQKELSGKGTLDEKVANTNLSKLNSSIYTDCKELSYRKDGNNVDIDVEQAYSTENQVRYYMLLDSITQEFNRLKSVLQK
ncbi:MAG: flagellar basal body rod protein FlgB [Clostridiales bacterium]|nr:flagellar basal body rod protein FlgB [Clostridiales bacterium]